MQREVDGKGFNKSNSNSILDLYDLGDLSNITQTIVRMQMSVKGYTLFFRAISLETR